MIILARLHSLRMVLVMLVAMTVFVGDDDKDVSEEVTILQQHTERNSRDDEQKHEAFTCWLQKKLLRYEE